MGRRLRQVRVMADVAIVNVPSSNVIAPLDTLLIPAVPPRPVRPREAVLPQIAHRLSAVAVLLLAGGLAAAYAGRETIGAGTKVLVLALVVAQFALVIALTASRRARRRGQLAERGLLGFCIPLLIVITLTLVADQFGWLQHGAMVIDELFASLSTQDIPGRRRPR